jgi:glycosyltransferase involved in cell wall biosynthesis
VSVTGASTPVTQKLRVMLVAPSLRTVGGQAVQADLLLRNWQDDPEAEVKFVPTDPEFPSLLKWAEKITGLRTLLRFPIYAADLWRASGQADVAHIFSASYWSFLIATVPALFITKWRGAKALINYRSGEAADHLANWRSARLLRKADAISVSSPFLAAVLQRSGYATTIVPNIVDIDKFDAIPRQPVLYRLVCTRNLEPYYGIDVVLRAFAVVQQEFSQATLDLIGSGPLESELRDLAARLGVTGVRFLGRVDPADIARYYRQAHAFINGSRLDNFPNSVLEALAAEAPIASTDPGGIKHIVEDGKTGLLSPIDDSAALAANVKRLFSDPMLAQALQANMHAAREQYRWPAVRAQWLKLYLSLQ